jgi:hypothetical protein
MKASILTLVATAALACGTQVAQAHLLVDDGAVVSFKSVSTKSSLAAMTAAGIRYHAAANYKNEQRLLGATNSGVRPDDRPGPRSI